MRVPRHRMKSEKGRAKVLQTEGQICVVTRSKYVSGTDSEDPSSHVSFGVSVAYCGPSHSRNVVGELKRAGAPSSAAAPHSGAAMFMQKSRQLTEMVPTYEQKTTAHDAAHL